MKIYQKLASSIQAKKNCEESGNEEWYDNHSMVIDHIVRNYLPSGSGIDSGCTIDTDKHETLVIYSSYHTMNEHGFYGEWVDFRVVVKPSLTKGIDLNIIGNFGKHQDLKDYLYDTFDYALCENVNQDEIKALYGETSTTI